MEQINALAKKERVPARIAKGDLEGKMKCRIWRKLHAEEAKRFDQSYTLMEQNPGLELADAFGVVQSGLTVKEFLDRKARTARRTHLKQARGAMDNSAVRTWIDKHVAEKTELTIVLGERTLIDVMTAEDRASFTFARAGRIEKLQVVLICRRSDWDLRMPTLDRDPRLAQKPASVARQPDQRPVSDPREFVELQGQKVWVMLRNGIRLYEVVQTVGPYDLLLGSEEIFVPLHALVKWDKQPPAPAPANAPAAAP